MDAMFANCKNFNKYIGKCDLSNVINTEYMFLTVKNLIKIL